MNCWPSGKYVHYCICTQYLVGAPFCFNYCLNSAWHGGDLFVALLRWYGSPGFFDSGLQLICIFLVSCSHFLLTIPHNLWGSGLVSLLASQAQQHHGHLTNFCCFGSVGRCQICWKMKSASLKSWSAEGSMKCSKISWVNRCSDVGFQKNTMDQHQPWHCTPNSSQTVKET